jgi:hypothetical protein
MSLDCPFLVAPRFSLTFICLSSSCFLCAEGCQCLWIVHSCFPLGFLSRLFVCLRPVSCVPMVANVSGLFILDNDKQINERENRGANKNGQSRDIGNPRYIRHRTKTNK